MKVRFTGRDVVYGGELQGKVGTVKGFAYYDSPLYLLVKFRMWRGLVIVDAKNVTAL